MDDTLGRPGRWIVAASAVLAAGYAGWGAVVAFAGGTLPLTDVHFRGSGSTGLMFLVVGVPAIAGLVPAAVALVVLSVRRRPAPDEPVNPAPPVGADRVRAISVPGQRSSEPSDASRPLTRTQPRTRTRTQTRA